MKTIVKLTISLPEMHNHEVGNTAKEILEIKRKTKIKAFSLIEEGLYKKPILKNMVERYISKELKNVNDKISGGKSN